MVVDLPPDELLLRPGRQGLSPPQAEHAAANFFRKGNLLALRELALRAPPTASTARCRLAGARPRCSRWAQPRGAARLRRAGRARREGRAQHSARLAAQLDACPGTRCSSKRQRCSASGRRSGNGAARPQVGAGTRRRHRDACRAGTGAGAGALRARPQSGASGRRPPGAHWPWRAQLVDERIVALAGDLDVLQIALPAGPGRAAPPALPGARTDEAPIPWPGRVMRQPVAACALTAAIAPSCTACSSCPTS